MGVYWARPTLEDIASQRAMIEQGEEIRKAARQAEERERLRDTFAAAALTGLLSNVQRYQNEPLTKQAYEIAEFMLRERERTNLDASPDARAKPSDRGPGQSQVGTGNTHKPVAWVRFYPNGGPESVYLDRPPVDAEPLYRHPPCQDLLQKNFTLTDAEREAIEFFTGFHTEGYGAIEIHADTLRTLLERLK